MQFNLLTYNVRVCRAVFAVLLFPWGEKLITENGFFSHCWSDELIWVTNYSSKWINSAPTPARLHEELSKAHTRQTDASKPKMRTQASTHSTNPHGRFTMSDDCESSIPPPCVHGWYDTMREGEGTEGEEKRHECRMNGDLMNTESFSTNFMDCIHKNYRGNIHIRWHRRERRWVTHVTWWSTEPHPIPTHPLQIQTRTHTPSTPSLPMGNEDVKT